MPGYRSRPRSASEIIPSSASFDRFACFQHFVRDVTNIFALLFNVSRDNTFSYFFPISPPYIIRILSISSFSPNEGSNIGWISKDAGTQRIDRDRREKNFRSKKGANRRLFYSFIKRTIERKIDGLVRAIRYNKEGRGEGGGEPSLTRGTRCPETNVRNVEQ